MKSYVSLHYIPIEDDGYHIQVSANVNDHNVRLIVDSGASRTVFDAERINRLKGTDKKAVPHLEAHGLGEEIESYLLHCDEINLFDHLLTDYTVVLVDLTPMNLLFGSFNIHRIAGILGGDLLARYNGIINYRKKNLKIAGKNYPLSFLSFPDGSFHITTHFPVNGKPACFLLDTGASKTVFDISEFPNLHHFDANEMIFNDKPSAGININNTEHQSILLEKLAFGYLNRPNSEVLLLDLSNINYTYSLLNLPPVDGILGNDMLQSLEAVINYKKKTLRLKD